MVLRAPPRRSESADQCPPRNESIKHLFWKRRYAEHYRGLGYQVEVEAPRKEGRMDVLATNDSEVVALEIETGVSDVVHNVRQDLLTAATESS